MLEQTKLFIRAKKGTIVEAFISTSSNKDTVQAQKSVSSNILANKHLHELDKRAWREAVESILAIEDDGDLHEQQRSMAEVADHLTEFICEKFGV